MSEQAKNERTEGGVVMRPLRSENLPRDPRAELIERRFRYKIPIR